MAQADLTKYTNYEKEVSIPIANQPPWRLNSASEVDNYHFHTVAELRGGPGGPWPHQKKFYFNIFRNEN